MGRPQPKKRNRADQRDPNVINRLLGLLRGLPARQEKAWTSPRGEVQRKDVFHPPLRLPTPSERRRRQPVDYQDLHDDLVNAIEDARSPWPLAGAAWASRRERPCQRYYEAAARLPAATLSSLSTSCRSSGLRRPRLLARRHLVQAGAAWRWAGAALAACSFAAGFPGFRGQAWPALSLPCGRSGLRLGSRYLVAAAAVATSPPLPCGSLCRIGRTLWMTA